MQTIKPRLAVLAAPAPLRHQQAKGPRIYDTARWKKGIRPAQLKRFPFCLDCLDHGLTVEARDVDHIDGNSANNHPNNLRSLCRGCHSRKTVARDGGFGNPMVR